MFSSLRVSFCAVNRLWSYYLIHGQKDNDRINTPSVCSLPQDRCYYVSRAAFPSLRLERKRNIPAIVICHGKDSLGVSWEHGPFAAAEVCVIRSGSHWPQGAVDITLKWVTMTWCHKGTSTSSGASHASRRHTGRSELSRALVPAMTGQ